MTRDRNLLALDLSVKVGRALEYPLVTLIVPVVWLLWFRRTRRSSL